MKKNKKDDAYIQNILVRYFPQGTWKTQIGPSGANNTTVFISVNGEQFVLRIYETHQDIEKAKYEQATLLALKELPVSFSIPEPILTQDGNTIVKAHDGKLAGLFRFLDGGNPSLEELEQVYSFGRIAAQLTDSLAKIQLNQLPVYRPYYEIESTHPRCSPSDVTNFCLRPPNEFSELADELRIISKQLASFRDLVPALQQLPHQLVHGDLNASNILVNQDGLVFAVLDFEFVTNDLRVMEAAVCLSDFIQPSQDQTMIWEKADAFLSGYGSAMKMTENEINALPELIQLRSLDVFIHFLGRYWDGIDPIETVKEYIQKAAIKVDWLSANKEKLTALGIKYL
ncbi:MAG: phosphotransferase [Bacillus sp. (in: firmicutes)]